MNSYDIVICGGGPAGLSCAAVLAKAGKSVLVLEKEKEPGKKVCACGITLNTFPKIPKDAVTRRFSRLIINTPSARTIANLDRDFLGTIDRKKLAKAQMDHAIAHSAVIHTGEKVLEIGTGKDKGTVRTDKGIYSYKALVGADGAGSLVRRHLGIKTKKIGSTMQYIIDTRSLSKKGKVSGNKKCMTGPGKEIEIFFDAGRFGDFYAWIFPNKGFLSAGTGLDPKTSGRYGLDMKKLRKNLDRFCAQRFDMATARFESFPINYDYRGHDFGDVFLAGEAAGLVSGLTGEGIGFAIDSGIDIAEKILDKDYRCPRIKMILHRKFLHEQIARSFMRGRLTTGLMHQAIAKGLGDRQLLHMCFKRFLD